MLFSMTRSLMDMEEITSSSSHLTATCDGDIQTSVEANNLVIPTDLTKDVSALRTLQ